MEPCLLIQVKFAAAVPAKAYFLQLLMVMVAEVEQVDILSVLTVRVMVAGWEVGLHQHHLLQLKEQAV